MLCVLIVEGVSVVVNVMLSLMSVIEVDSPLNSYLYVHWILDFKQLLLLLLLMSPPPALCNLLVRTDVKLCIFGVLALGVSLVS